MSPAQQQDIVIKEHGAKNFLIAAFVPTPAESLELAHGGGNPCLLSMLEEAPAGTQQTAAKFTRCQSWPTTYRRHSAITVGCYTSTGKSIQCCGHGLMSAAYGWLQQLQSDALLLVMNHSIVRCWREQDEIWLRFPRAPTKAVAVPSWIPEIFPVEQQPIAAAVCGDDQGYLVLQWADDFQLKQLNPKLDKLLVHSQRAFICTSAQPSVANDTIQLRYFAPQYGVDEDPATGSAMRVLADYWEERFISLTAEQCSPEGGRLLARPTPGYVEVGGRCTLLGTE